MELPSDNGKYISFILNSELSYGGVTFGWRKLTEWTNLKIKRTNGLTKVYFGKSKTPQYTQEYDEDELYFIFRLNGLEDEYHLKYRNFKIVSSNRVIFKDFYQKDDVELMLKNIADLKNEIEHLSEESELLQKTVDSQNILLNTILVHYELVPKQIIKNLHELYKEF